LKNMTVSIGSSLALAFLCFSMFEGQAAAPSNLLPQGDFKNPGANTGWAEGFNIPQNQEFQVVSKDGQSWLRIENHDPGRQLDYVHAYVKLSPEIESLTISARLRATNLKVGKEGWHDARVALCFEGGSFGYPAQVPELAADSDWVTKSVELKVPKGATRLNIQPAMFRCTGVFEIADLIVTPRLAVTTQLADAVLPAGMSLNWDKTSIVTVNAKRAQVSLDGIWRFIPAAEGSAEPPPVGWAYIKVPGSWQGRAGGARGTMGEGVGPATCWPWAAARSGISTMGHRSREPGTSDKCSSRRHGKAERSACASTACARTRWFGSTARSAEESPGRGARWTSRRQ
jgi:hypothetical protein